MITEEKKLLESDKSKNLQFDYILRFDAGNYLSAKVCFDKGVECWRLFMYQFDGTFTGEKFWDGERNRLIRFCSIDDAAQYAFIVGFKDFKVSFDDGPSPNPAPVRARAQEPGL